jgi:hypothetical protein
MQKRDEGLSGSTHVDLELDGDTLRRLYNHSIVQSLSLGASRQSSCLGVNQTKKKQ